MRKFSPSRTLGGASNELRVSRRHVLQGMLASAVPASVLLAACRSESRTYQQTANTGGDVLKPAVVLYEYGPTGDPGTATQSAVDTLILGATTVPDRFELGECYRYEAQNSFATSDEITAFPEADFALSFWFLSASKAPMHAVMMAGSEAPLMRVEFNTRQTGVTVTYGDHPAQLVSAGTPGAYTNGVWRHFCAQRKNQGLELFMDGVFLGSVACADVARTNVRVHIGVESLGWTGVIDDLRIHTRSFEADEVPHMVYVWNEVHTRVNVGSFAAFYRCDDFDGIALNDTGKAPDALTFNIAPATDRFGDELGAYWFDGETSYMQLATELDRMLADFAVGFWARTQSIDRIVAFSSSPSTRASLVIALNDAGSGITARVGDANVAVAAGGVAGQFADDAWHFYFVQRVGTELQLFVDGQLLHSVSCAVELWGPDSAIRIGRSFDGDPAGEGYWNGAIDDVQIYVRSYPEEEAVQLGALTFWPRDGAGPLTFDGRMWLLGGWNPSLPEVTNNEIWWSTDGAEWIFAGEAPWEGRHNAGYAVLGGRMWLVGGDFNREHYQNEVWSSTDGVDWTLVTDDVPWRDRMGQHVVAFAGRLWLLGGEQLTSTPGISTVFNDVYSSTDGSDWQLVTTNAPWQGRSLILGNAVFRGRIWIMGGGSYATRQYLNDVWSSADGATWERMTEQAPWSPRLFHSIEVYHDKLWVIAGVDAQNVAGLSDVWYSDDGVTWTQLDRTPWDARHAASVTVHDRHLWIAAGSNNSLYNDVWRLGYAP